MTNEEAIRRLKEGAPFSGLYVEEWEESLNMAIDALQERKEGKWIYHIDDLFPAESTKECDQCRTHQDLNCDSNFCPWCGAKMKEENAK